MNIKKILLFIGIAMLGAFSFAVSFPQTTHAAGETFEWVDRNRIRMTGGDFVEKTVDGSRANTAGEVIFSLSSGRLASSGAQVYTAEVPLSVRTGVFNRQNCSVWLQITEISSAAQNAGVPRTTAKQISQNITDPGSSNNPDCALDNNEWGGWELPTIVDNFFGIIALREADRPEADDDELDLPAPEENGTSPIEDMQDIVGEGVVEEVPDDPVCTGGTMGWFLCPFAVILSSTTGFLANIIEGLLIIDPLTLSTDNPIFTVWSLVRDLANVGLILVFLVVIISQITSMGLSNYGIKRILPRLIIAAILLNVSYYICALAVDVFNLLGAGVQGLFAAGIDATRVSANPDEVIEIVGPNAGQWLTMIGISLAALAAAAYTGVLPLIMIPLSIGAAAILTAFVVLVIRQVLVTLLIILAPLAFLAWLAPGTSGYFDTWRKTLTTLLMTYPVVMALFYGSAFVASVISTAGISDNISGADSGEWITAIVSFVVLALPIILLPTTMRLAGGLGKSLSSLSRSPKGGAFKWMRGKGREWSDASAGKRRAAISKTAQQTRRDQKWAARRRGEGRFGAAKKLYTQGVLGSVDRKVPKLPGSKARDLADQRGVRQANLIRTQEDMELAKALKDAIKGSEIQLTKTHGNDTAAFTRALTSALESNNIEDTVAATNLLVKNKDIGSLQGVLKKALDSKDSQQLTNLHEAFRENLPALDAMAPELAEFATTNRNVATQGNFSTTVTDSSGATRNLQGLDALTASAFQTTNATGLVKVRKESMNAGVQYIRDDVAAAAANDSSIINSMGDGSRKIMVDHFQKKGVL